MAKDFDIYSNDDDGEVEVYDARHYTKESPSIPVKSDVNELRKEVLAATDNIQSQLIQILLRVERIELARNTIASMAHVETKLNAIADSAGEANEAVSDISKCIAGNTVATKAQVDRVESKLNRIIGLDDSGELFGILVSELSKILGEEWLNVECDGDVIRGVRVLKAQIDEQEELRRKAMAGLREELQRKPTKRERFIQAAQWLVYDSFIARFFEAMR